MCVCAFAFFVVFLVCHFLAHTHTRTQNTHSGCESERSEDPTHTNVRIFSRQRSFISAEVDHGCRGVVGCGLHGAGVNHGCRADVAVDRGCRGVVGCGLHGAAVDHGCRGGVGCRDDVAVDHGCRGVVGCGLHGAAVDHGCRGGVGCRDDAAVDHGCHGGAVGIADGLGCRSDRGAGVSGRESPLNMRGKTSRVDRASPQQTAAGKLPRRIGRRQRSTASAAACMPRMEGRKKQAPRRTHGCRRRPAQPGACIAQCTDPAGLAEPAACLA